mmetsp:Transcript_11960/g.33671  ORF Transcript_11960/g.33671 Transcript_11960/m.33671 type:complete len:262 (+) Transcript_11960:6159-6944(+)
MSLNTTACRLSCSVLAPQITSRSSFDSVCSLATKRMIFVPCRSASGCSSWKILLIMSLSATHCSMNGTVIRDSCEASFASFASWSSSSAASPPSPFPAAAPSRPPSSATAESPSGFSSSGLSAASPAAASATVAAVAAVAASAAASVPPFTADSGSARAYGLVSAASASSRLSGPCCWDRCGARRALERARNFSYDPSGAWLCLCFTQERVFPPRQAPPPLLPLLPPPVLLLYDTSPMATRMRWVMCSMPLSRASKNGSCR